jgi:hypothetical protein
MRPLLLTLLAAAALLLPTSTNAQTSNCFRDAYGRVTCRSTGGFTRITPNPYGNGGTIYSQPYGQRPRNCSYRSYGFGSTSINCY